MSTICFTLELHFGGKSEWEPHVVYNGGSVTLIDNCGPDRMSLFEIRDLYKEAGGEGTVVDYYFRVPGYPLDIGTMRLNSNKDVSRMLEMYTGLPVVVVYAEKVGDPLIAISPCGKVLNYPKVSKNTTSTAQKALPFQGVNIDDFDILFDDDCYFYDKVVCPPTPPHTFTNDTPHMEENNEERVMEDEVVTEERVMEDEVVTGEDLEEDHSGCNANSGEDDSDESDDSDYVRGSSSESGDSAHSSDPSWMFEDLEGPDDDDIFANNGRSGEDLQEGQQNEETNNEGSSKTKDKEPMVTEKEVEVADGPWYSDPEDDEVLGSVIGSDEDEPVRDKNIEFNESMMRKPKLVAGMKFPSAQVFRAYLREYNVRNGYDITYIRNENKRITAKCKYWEDKDGGCQWRIHGSPVGRLGLYFQLKTLTYTHTCGRHYENSQVTSTYLGQKMADEVRDNPDINPETLKKKIKRKVMVNKRGNTGGGQSSRVASQPVPNGDQSVGATPNGPQSSTQPSGKGVGRGRGVGRETGIGRGTAAGSGGGGATSDINGGRGSQTGRGVGRGSGRGRGVGIASWFECGRGAANVGIGRGAANGGSERGGATIGGSGRGGTGNAGNERGHGSNGGSGRGGANGGSGRGGAANGGSGRGSAGNGGTAIRGGDAWKDATVDGQTRKNKGANLTNILKRLKARQVGGPTSGRGATQ
ncbi:hypothetical protein RHGRI_000857 [Rhododendron griersonianum]|uniref:Transposase MuDR plant domain-containing protein n=1 Tax=Rhododendron griersonianum TaxID=479676 RepID=A0AAV6LL91_9ERIC|nr:hypothetical protein RHGRI_000857 [Rhododendron griersonianum]